MPHMPQLDGLRGVAVSAVLVHHLLIPLPQLATPVPWGLLGVRLFFVLSGFLITGLLIKAIDAHPERANRPSVLKHFYIRRTLRIFPIYYLVLAAAFVLRPPEVAEQLPWLATYTYNFWISHLGWYPAYFAHFWSLCVEEQFYLLWPLLLVFLSRRHAYACALLMVLAAPLFRVAALAGEVNPVASYTLTPSSLDALGLGALLAFHTAGQRAPEALEKRLRLVALPLCFAGLFAARFSKALDDVLSETFVAIAFVWLVAAASRGFPGIVGRVLEAAPVTYLGKISYGIYVYHLLLRDYVRLDFLAIGSVPKEILEFAVYCAGTIALASVSWFALERPINRLKDRW
jgi:peptidoglycan/LPS O-acetylase OafA/YrhL